MCVEKREDDRAVDNDGSIILSRGHAPDQEDHFDEEVHREPGEQNINEDFGDGEGSVDDPVGEPLLGHFGIARFERLD